MTVRWFAIHLFAISCALCLVTVRAAAQTQNGDAKLFARDNLVAWCIVPFDSKKRGPEERADMLARLGFKRFAYDWRAEHIPTFDAEMEALRKRGIQLDAFWFPASLNKDARAILAVLERHHIKTQLWVSMSDPAPASKDQGEKVEAAVRVLRPIAEVAARIGCTVGLYNHGGWYGEPENQLAILERLKLPNVGLVYNLHHGHDHLDRFGRLLPRMKSHLLALNLNGMVKDGDKVGKKILPLGQGDLDLSLLKTIRESGYRGPIGILGHTQDDAEERLRDNLDGLDWLVPQLDGKQPGPKPKPRTGVPAAPAGSARPASGWIAEGRLEYRTPPLTVECRARLNSKQGYNILVANDTKASGAHWELFTMAGRGTLAVYLPGMRPDHVHTSTNICDGEWHTLGMHYEPQRIRLYVDGKQVADQAVTSAGKAVVPGGLALGRLVEGGIGCDGTLAWVRLSQGVRAIDGASKAEPEADTQTIGLWRLDSANPTQVEDRSARKNPAKQVSSQAPAKAAPPPPGNHLLPVDDRLKAILIDRSENDAYMAVKVDSAGRLFVGGREAVFVFEPNTRGGYGPRRELLRFPPDSIIIGLEFRGNDLYVLAANALYLVPDGRIKREGLSPQRLLWGVPLDLHVSFHCLAWGPEGDLYLDHGDPLLRYGDWSRPDHWGHWTLFPRPEGTRVPYTGVGSVLRIKPDGSGLQVVAGGLRGPVGLAFDRDWQLFTNDNDHESRADLYAPARLMHVTPQIDFAWPRGWLASMSPERSDLVEPMIATLGRGVPCDLAYYDEPLLPELFRHSLLMCRWDRMGVMRYPLRPRGASFATEEQPFLNGEHQARPVGVAVGRGGRVFVTSLYLGGNVVLPYCPSDLVMVTRSDDPAEHPFDAYDVATVSAERLWADLSSLSWERRSRAHGELLRRGGPLLTEAAQRLAGVKEVDPALNHLMWLAGAGSTEAASRQVASFARHTRPGLRLQAVRVLAEFPHLRASPDVFATALADADPRVQLAALAYYFTAPQPLPVPAVAKLAASTDTYLRQTAAKLLARRATFADIDALARSTDDAVRLAGVLAAGMRLTVPPANEQPPEKLPLHYPAANAFFHTRLHFADGSKDVDLRDVGRVGSYTTAERWKAIVPGSEELALFGLLVRSLDDTSEPVQLQAAYWLALLRDAKAEPLIARARRGIHLKRLSSAVSRTIDKVWTVGPFPDGVRATGPEPGLIDLGAEYVTPAGKLTWRELTGTGGRYSGKALFGDSGRQTCWLLFRLQSLRRQAAALVLPSESDAQLWHNSQATEGTSSSPAGDRLFVLELRPGSNDVLLRLHGSADREPIALAYRAAEGVAASLPEKLDASLLTRRLREGSGVETIAAEFLAVDWTSEARKGDAAQGRRLFGSLGCVKCHAITPTQESGGAPSLTEARLRFTVPYLVESILLPSTQIAEPFRGSTLALANGQVLSGLVVNESADSLEVLVPDGTPRTIPKKEIEERALSRVSPMPAGVVRTPAELRDILAYLLSANPTPP